MYLHKLVVGKPCPVCVSIYSRTSEARTLMACLPQLFQTLKSLTKKKKKKKNPIAADIIVFGFISSDFLFHIDNGMLCVLIRIASIRQF